MFNVISKRLITKKIHYFIFLILYFSSSCNEKNSGKVDICHYDKKTDKWQTITVNKNKIHKHLEHGDPVEGGCEEYTYVVDTVFEKLLFELNYDSALDNHVLISNVDSITHLNIEGRPNQKVRSLVGIEAFKRLKILSCRGNRIKQLDLRKNIALTELYCYENDISNLDISKNINLEILFCGANKLTSIDVSKNIKLKDLHCYSNQLTSLDISNNINLERLYIQVNNFNKIDISKNSKLMTLHCNNNPLLQNLNLENNSNLEVLYCHNNGLTSLDVSNNPKLKTLHCNDNELKNINIKNRNNKLLKNAEFRVFNNPNLTCIQVDSEAWSNANWPYKDPKARFSVNCIK